MSPRTLTKSRHVIDTCTIHLNNWKPFDQSQSQTQTPSSKRPCLTDRTSTTLSIETLDMSKMSIFEDEGYRSSVKSRSRRDRMHWMARKRRRRGSRSVSAVSGRSCSNAYGGTCSDFIMGTDSSGEMFNWGSDVSEVGVVRNLDRETSNGGTTGLVYCNYGYVNSNGNGNVGDGNGNGNGNESGYGSEPGYRGDAELGYGDEFDEEEDDTRLLFWGTRFGDAHNMEIIGENTMQKAHHRCRRKKHELRMVDAV